VFCVSLYRAATFGLGACLNIILFHRKIVGTGTSGIVYLATYKGAQVAVKLFHPYLFELEEEKPKYMSELLQEMTILASLSSPYIIGFLGGVRQPLSPSRSVSLCGKLNAPMTTSGCR
jgi:serine/threonine protein kinase